MSRRPPAVILEQPAKSFSGFDDALALSLRPAEHLVSETLMTALIVIVSRVLCDCSNKRLLPHEDHLIEKGYYFA